MRNNWVELGISVRTNGSIQQRVPCPKCNKGMRDDALGVNIQTGAFHCFRCGWKRSHVTGDNTTSTLIIRHDDPAIAARKRDRLRRTWRESVPLNHSAAGIVRAYLESRALGEVLKAPPPVLRAHPGLTYWDGLNDLGRYPAMVALFHGASGEPVTLHVTYLRSDGCAKAAVPNPKKILGVPVRGATKGGAIHLYEPTAGILGIAEGIESALSLHVLQKLPGWASFCADNLARAQLPQGLKELYIAVDVDESGKGQQVAQDLVKRLRIYSPRTKAFYVKPDADGTGDLNDNLRKRMYGKR